MTIKITGLTFYSALPNKGGSRITAFFDWHNADIGMRGCALVQNSAGAWRVWAPKLEESTRSVRRSADAAVIFRREGKLEGEVLDAALALYRAMGGNEAPADRPSVEDQEDDAGLRKVLAG